MNLYGEDRITRHQLAEALGPSCLETERVFKRHDDSSGLTEEEMRTQTAALRAKYELAPNAI